MTTPISAPSTYPAAQKTTSRVLVVHQGKRDDYQLAAAFAEAGKEVLVVTTAYGTSWVKGLAKILPLRGLKKLAARKNKLLDDHCVVQLFWSEIFSKIIHLVRGESAALEWIDCRLANEAIRILKTHPVDIIFCYNYNAFRIFNHAAAKDSKKFIFQCHPFPLAIKNIFKKAIELGLVPAVNSEKEFSYSDSYQAMLIAEPMLADRIFCASTFTKNSLVSYGFDSRSISTVPYGVNSLRISGETYRSSAKILKIIFVGQFVYRKGIRSIARILNALNFPVEITFVGRGIRELNPLEAITNPLIRAEIIWDASNEELADSYANAHVFLFPSIVEGFAHVVLEAMRSGCVPIISANTCGGDVVDHGINGFIFDAFEFESFVAALVEVNSKLAEYNGLAIMSEAAIEKAALYDWDSFRQKMRKEVYG